MLKVLRNCGLAIRQFELGYEGSILWDLTRYVNPIQFDHAWHQTRCPLHTISSISASADVFWRNMLGRVPRMTEGQHPLLKSMLYWLWWSELCEEQARWRYKVEDISEGSDTWLEICDRLELGDVIFPSFRTDTNSKLHYQYTWSELYQVDRRLATSIAQKTERYGYHVMSE